MDIKDIVGEVSKLDGGNPMKLLGAVSGLVGNSQGLSGLVDQLTKGGLGNEVSSWIGKGENKAVDPKALANAIGPDKVAAVAAQAGVSPQEAQGGLAAMLPKLIDQLTPNGSVPTSGVGSILSGLKGVLG
jgi:uncharacterized protein YidB (DUF937 family)